MQCNDFFSPFREIIFNVNTLFLYTYSNAETTIISYDVEALYASAYLP